MREIKFRGKRINNGEWVCGMPVFDTGGQRYIITEMMSQITCCSDCGMPDVIYYDVDPDTVGQYTGRKDENETGIYEGDIIEGGYHNRLTDTFTSKRYVIEYANCHYTGRLIGHSPYGDQWLEFIDGEIIGNIHDNPELLGGAK